MQSSPNDLVIQLVPIAESIRLQQLLATFGIQTQTPHQVEPIQIWPPFELAKAYQQLGVNDKLGLTGRPPRPIGRLGTSKVRQAANLPVNVFNCITSACRFVLLQINIMALTLDRSY